MAAFAAMTSGRDDRYPITYRFREWPAPVISEVAMSKLTELKLKIGRAQLATGLDLFIRDKDPVSIQCLACGGGEIIEGVARLKGVEPFSTHALEEHPHLNVASLKRIRNQYWNAFKHLIDRQEALRDDEELLRDFNDSKNDAALFVGWRDYHAIAGAVPIEVQVFQVWWYALNEGKLSPNANFERIRETFPQICSVDRGEQKRRLRRTVEKWRRDPALLADPRTEPRLLAKS